MLHAINAAFLIQLESWEAAAKSGLVSFRKETAVQPIDFLIQLESWEAVLKSGFISAKIGHRQPVEIARLM